MNSKKGGKILIQRLKISKLFFFSFLQFLSEIKRKKIRIFFPKAGSGLDRKVNIKDILNCIITLTYK